MSEEPGTLATEPGPTVSDPVGQGGGHADDADHSHGLSDMGYVRIAIVLAVITAVEVAWSYLPQFKDSEGATHLIEVGGLLLMMIVKFVVVASNFMHLKFDDKLLTRIFYAGLILAVGVYMAALTTFHVFY